MRRILKARFSFVQYSHNLPSGFDIKKQSHYRSIQALRVPEG
jgi:hypothetical protein